MSVPEAGPFAEGTCCVPGLGEGPQATGDDVEGNLLATVPGPPSSGTCGRGDLASCWQEMSTRPGEGL